MKQHSGSLKIIRLSINKRRTYYLVLKVITDQTRMYILNSDWFAAQTDLYWVCRTVTTFVNTKSFILVISTVCQQNYDATVMTSLFCKLLMFFSLKLLVLKKDPQSAISNIDITVHYSCSSKH